MAKIKLSTIASTTDVSSINANFKKLETELNDKVLYRNNPAKEVNTLATGIDANGQAIFNLPAPVLAHQAARLGDIQQVLSMTEDAAEAAVAALAASEVATVAAGTAVNAANSALSAVGNVVDDVSTALMYATQAQAASALAVPKEDTHSFLYAMSSDEQTDSKLTIPTIDLSAKVQAFIDANKGKRIVFPSGYSYMMAGVTMDGSTYNGTQIVFEGELFLKARPTTSSATYQGAWVGLLIKDCSNVSVNFRGHGNRTNQPNEEHVYLMGLAGVRNFSMPTFFGREVRGDGLYISQKEWTSSSANTLGVTIGLFDIVNSTSDGRNGISLISGDNISIGQFRSINVGAVVGGFTQPGGFDIEPDQSYQSCKNIVVGSFLAVHAGTSGLAIAGRPGFDVTNNVNIGTALVVNTSASSVADGAGAGAITQSPNHTLIVTSATDVTIGSYRGVFTNTYGDAIIIGNVNRVNIKGSVRHVREGARIGGDQLDATLGGTGVMNSKIDIDVYQTTRFGIRTGKVSASTKIKGEVYGPVTGFYPGGLMGVIAISFDASNLYTQSDVEYSVSVQADANWARSYRKDSTFPVTFNNVVIRDCDLSGSTWGDPTYQFGDFKVPYSNVRGITDRATVPPALSAYFVDGQRFNNTSPGGLNVPLGWRYDATANLMRPILANVFARAVFRNYQLTENFDASLYDLISLNIQANGALTYNAPTGGTVGQDLTITVKNVSGGAMGAITWNAAFKMAGDWVNPANGKNRSITFYFDGTNWIQKVPVTGDVSN